MKPALVSIGVPARNAQNWLRRALDSLLAQNYPDIEIVISDNCSSDKTAEICREYQSQHSQIRLFRHDNMVGLFENFRTVLQESSGQYFMWAAVDDAWHPDFITKLVDKIKSDRRIAVAQAATTIVLEDDLNEPIETIRFTGSGNLENRRGLGATSRILSPNKYNYYIYGIFHREILLQAFDFFPNVPSSDRLFLLQIPLAGYKFGYVDEPLYVRTIHNKPNYVRYSGDPYAERVRKSFSKWFDAHSTLALIKILNSSPLAGRSNKLSRACVVFQYILFRARTGFTRAVRSLRARTTNR